MMSLLVGQHLLQRCRGWPLPVLNTLTALDSWCGLVFQTLSYILLVSQAQWLL